jgi:hypothetical protein
MYSILVVKREGKRQQERPKRRWKDSIRMDVREIGWKDVDWTHLAQDREHFRAFVYTVMNLRFP